MISKIKLTWLVAATCFFVSCNNDSTTTKETKTDSSTSQPATTTPATTNATANKNVPSNLMASLDTMLARMKDLKMTGDFDIDFANMIILHHQAAIDMSEKELRSGADEKIKSMAQKIIATKKDEITLLQGFLETYKPSGVKRKERQLERTMSYIQSRMISARLPGNMDKDFAIMMSAHHDASTVMARNELVYGVNDVMKKLAQKMITEQTQELSEFKSWLNNEK